MAQSRLTIGAAMSEEIVRGKKVTIRFDARRCIHSRHCVLDRPDVFLSGDLALRRTIQHQYGFDHLPTDDELIELSDRWRPYRSLAVSYLFASEYGA